MTERFYAGIRKWLGQSALVRGYRKFRSIKELPKYSPLKASQQSTPRKSIIFLCPATNVPRGGVKVIYHQAAVINENIGVMSASVLHPLSPEFNCTWFEHHATFKRNLEFDPQHDFVMVPEFWAVPHGKLLNEIGVRYGIYVQNGYALGLNNSDGLEAAYSNADLILTISDDTVECINLAYPQCSGRIHRVHCSVNPDQFIANSEKENMISYMPRRLKRHSDLVIFFLNKRIPPHWKIEAIDGLNEAEVATVLKRSKIFLSFSELEGLGLPPIEAALSGCHIIGYTGEAAKEYWDNKIFTEIHAGDIRAFVTAVLDKIDEFEKSPTTIQTDAISRLANKYSAQVELADMQFVSQEINRVLNHTES